MIDPNERHTFIDKNWDKGISWMDPDSDYWKKAHNIDQSGIREWNDEIRSNNGRIVRIATKEELAELVAP